MSKNLQFRISSALKDIIGRDLITDDYVAVFELVKNSYDAHAQKVEITFKNIYSENAKIIINDNGRGMNFDDLIEKWFFLAYSAKKEGTEDNNFDYRDRIYSNKPFAGAKGIGRFSCDRLGKNLYLETTKLEENPATNILITNWGKFEEDSKKEFIEIPVSHEMVAVKDSKFIIPNGTVLEISDLRSTWDREKLIKLKDSLSKLINPHNQKDSKRFSIIIDVPEELQEDQKRTEYRDIINGEVKNFVFETLELKTTRITSSIDEKGEFISSKLLDGGTTIYEITQKNNYRRLKNIDITLFYLNRAAKYSFNRKMGMASRVYGNVFLYKNGFRVYPYGEPFSDSLGIDKRKSRKAKSRIGTGELIGRIEITDSTTSELIDQNDIIKESASRGDGLIKNNSYYELEKFFIDVIEKLEKYVVDVQQWGISIEDDDNIPISSRVIDLLSKVTNTNDIIDFSVPDNFLDIIEVSQADSADAVVKNLNKIAIDIGNKQLLGIAEKAVKKVKILQEARERAERETDEALELAQQATAKLKSQITENLFLKSINTSDYQEMISLLHHVGIYAGTIENNLKHISLRVQNKIPLSNAELYDIIKQIGLDVKKISNIVVFATKAKFNLETETTTIDLINYIKEYVENIIPTIIDDKMKIQFIDITQSHFTTNIKPIEISIIIDNLISNARKAKSTNLSIRTSLNKNSDLIVEFEDDGIGIRLEHIDDIFNIGYTTTDGSGVGLYHVKDILNKMGSKISVNNNTTTGITFSIIFKEKK